MQRINDHTDATIDCQPYLESNPDYVLMGQFRSDYDVIA